MEEQNLRQRIKQCNRTINELKEKLKQKKKDLEELEHLAEAVRAIGKRIQSSRDSAVQRIGRKIASFVTAIKGAVFNDIRSSVDGREFKGALQSANNMEASATKKAREVSQEIEEIRKKIKQKEQERDGYQYRLNHLKEEG